MFRKSQITLTDLFVAIFMATVLIIIIVFAWNRYTTILNDEANYKELQIIAFQTADLLVKSGGQTKGWERSPESVQVIGLASSDRNLSTEKVNAFVNLDYNITSKALGVELYNFHFQLNHINGTKLAEHGKTPSESVVNVQRIVSYKNEKAVLEFGLWK